MTQVHDPVVLLLLVKTVLTQSCLHKREYGILKKVGHGALITLNTVY